jgi:hypothetical protein
MPGAAMLSMRRRKDVILKLMRLLVLRGSGNEYAAPEAYGELLHGETNAQERAIRII